MRIDEDRALFARVFQSASILFASFCLLAVPAVYAQDGSDDAVPDADDEQLVEEVVVTGSRLKRNTYSSVAPLQVITGEISREIGAIDPSTICRIRPVRVETK